MIKGSITISRTSNTINGDHINIRVRDEDAVINFLDLKMSLTDFAQAITGLAVQPCEFEVSGLENLGKRREHKNFEFKVRSYDKKLAEKEAVKQCPKGWTPSLYFGSQTSFFTKDKEVWARTFIYRWREKDD